MKRRDFLKASGYGLLGLAAGAVAAPQTKRPSAKAPKAQGTSVAGLRAPKLDRVRAAFIGVGARGPGHIESCLMMEGVDITAICDIHEPSAKAAAKMVTDAGRPEPPLYMKGEHDYRRMLERDDIDAVFIATPWGWHVPMAVDTMLAGKHAFLEVPASPTLQGCWDLVDTAEKTRKHCMMMENVCYGREELMVLNMCRLGVFGELLHGEAAYIHDLRGQMEEIEHGTGSWRTYEYTKRNGNLYPTHGLGPVAQYMNINRGDRFEYLSSMSSNSRVRAEYAKKHFPEGHERRTLKFIAGDINTSIVRTALGRTIMIQWDEQLPRPYTRHNLIQGTHGVWAGFPGRVVVEDVTPNTDSWVQGDGLKAFYDKYDHPLWKKLSDPATKHGGHGGMDFVMMWRIITALRNGLPMDQDVYDAASWSVVSPLSEWSVANRGQSIDFPDFTRGQWRTNAPLEMASMV